MSNENEQFIDELAYTDPYEYHMQNEPHLNKTPIEVDEETGWRYTFRDIGMTRNAPEEKQKEMKVFLDPSPHVLVDQNVPLRGWYKEKHDYERGKRPRPCFTDSLLTQPYGGFCHVGCGFCYINNGVRGYRGQGVSTVDVNYPAKIKKQLKKMRTGAAVYMSSFIDPFLDLEDYYHNTYWTARAAGDEGLPIYFLTRKIMPGWAWDELKRSPYSYLQMSINTPNSEDWRKMSPHAAALPDLIDQVREAKRQGVYTSIQVNPIVAGVTSVEEIEELIYILADAGADHLIFKFVEIVYPSAPHLAKNMYARFGEERARAFEELFTQNIGGMKTIQEEYRIAAHDRFLYHTKQAGVTMSLCYEYKYERNEDGSIKNKIGKSLGRDYITADQCHGHKVPMFSRASEDELFQPMEDKCQPTGCLYCGDDHGGEENVPCGNERLAQAPALTPQDLKRPADTVKHGVIPIKQVNK